MRLAEILGSRLAAYAAVNAVAAGATFLAVPVLVRLLGLGGFGTWSLLEPIVFFGTTLALLGAEHGTMKDIAYEGQDMPTVLGELLATGGPAILLTGTVVLLVAAGFVGWGTAALVAGAAMAEGLLMLTTSAARAARRSWAFAVGQIGRSLGFLGLLLVAGAVAGGLGVAEALALRLGLVAALLVAMVVLLAPRPRINAARHRAALRYGVFILVASLLTLGLDMVDRYVVGLLFGAEVVGAYMVHVKLASVVGQGIVMPFSLWFAAERLRHVHDPDGGARFFDRVALGLTAACAAAAGSAQLAGPALVGMLAPGVAFDAASLAALLVASSLIGLTYALNIGMLKPGHTHLNVAPVALGLVVALLAAPVLTWVAGPEGAAAGRLLGTLAFLVVLARMSQRIHPVAFSHRAMASIALATALLVAAVAAALPGDTLAAAALRVTAFLGLWSAAGLALLRRGMPDPAWSAR